MVLLLWIFLFLFTVIGKILGKILWDILRISFRCDEYYCIYILLVVVDNVVFLYLYEERIELEIFG